MKLTFKGIGWLIFGLLIIVSTFDTYGWRDKLSSMGIGVTFIAVYVMKQFFKPRWYGFFIAGGILLSFCIYNGFNRELIYPLLLAAAFMGVFYWKNREPVNAMIEDIDTLGNDELGNFDYVDPETYTEPSVDPSAAEGEEASSGEAGESSGGTDDDGAIEIEAKVPAQKAKTVEFDLDSKR